MNPFWKNPLIWITWLIPLLLFPTYGEKGMDSFTGVSYYGGHGGKRADWEPDDPIVEVVRYAPVFMSLSEGNRPAKMFLPTEGSFTSRSHILNPHWRYWFMWIGAAIVITIIIGRRRERVPLAGPAPAPQSRSV